MKLPVIAGFIFPNGEKIETAGIGHCKMALRYILEHNLLQQYEISKLAEDDFLIEKLGAAKIAMYRGKKYIYVPYHHNWYISQIKEIYSQSGYEVHYILSYGLDIDENYSENGAYNGIFSYNQIVIPKVCKDGSIVLIYNPKRIGD